MSLAGVIGLLLLVLAPSSTSAVENATLNVKVVVINSYGGTFTPADFTVHVKYLMKDVAGSPFHGITDSETALSLPPGSYLITTDVPPVSGGYVTYYGNYSGTNIVNGFVTLAAGEVVTITRNEFDWPAAGATTTPPTTTPIPPTTTPAPVTPATQVGGTLPKTASPWYNMLAISFGLMLVGGLGFTLRKAAK